MEKGEYRRAASELGIIIVCPDTSPRGDDDVADEAGNCRWARVRASISTRPRRHGLSITNVFLHHPELPMVIAANFRTDMGRQGIFGHSMGGHGALTIALKNPERYKSCSAFAPIVNPMEADWSVPGVREISRQ